ncbi:uncharacterized protein NPIL_70281 [Nephila pilipes]|uniref:Uncharacterized protein n=1 Tax=Nephila pilipes TaxID=299642 RepID=A0A8X6T3N5_NEPPI|nr:uncharacterized protein NPIL_70281 [Nephila pilipes]
MTLLSLLPTFTMQDLWKYHFSWDEELSPHVVDRFSKWLNEMYLFKDITLPRFINFNETSELNVFIDAYMGTFVACVFFTSEVRNKSKVRLIRPKNKVDPLKLLRIPRLKFIGQLHRSKTDNAFPWVFDTTSINVTLWSDFTVAL